MEEGRSDNEIPEQISSRPLLLQKESDVAIETVRVLLRRPSLSDKPIHLSTYTVR